MEILFSRQHDVYPEFSNFHDAPIELDGRIWPTVEHYFQAQKFNDLARSEEVRAAKSPHKSRQIGRQKHLR